GEEPSTDVLVGGQGAIATERAQERLLGEMVPPGRPAAHPPEIPMDLGVVGVDDRPERPVCPLFNTQEHRSTSSNASDARRPARDYSAARVASPAPRSPRCTC